MYTGVYIHMYIYIYMVNKKVSPIWQLQLSSFNSSPGTSSVPCFLMTWSWADKGERRKSHLGDNEDCSILVVYMVVSQNKETEISTLKYDIPPYGGSQKIEA